MIQPPGISTIDVPCSAPFMSGSYDLELNNKGIFWETMHDLGAEPVPTDSDVLNLQFCSGSRVGHAAHMDFGSGLGLNIYRSLWTSGTSELIYQRRDYYMLSLRLSGNCQESLDDKVYLLGGHTCTLFNLANDLRYRFQISGDEPFTEVCIRFDASFLKDKFKLGDRELNRILHPEPYRLLDPLFNQCKVTPAMEQIGRELLSADSADNTYRLYTEAKAMELISIYLSELEAQANTAHILQINQRDLNRLYQVKAQLEDNFREPPNIEHLCHLAGFNRRKITESFKAQFGKTIYEYVQHLRMEKAKQLLSNGYNSVALVAEQVGYCHQSNFTKAFKRHVGLSPLKFSARHFKHSLPSPRQQPASTP